MLIKKAASWRAQLGLRLSARAEALDSDLATALTVCRAMSSRQELP